MEKEKQIEIATTLFGNTYLECKAYYMHVYNQTPCLLWIDQVNVNKAFTYVKSEYADAIVGIYQYSKFNRKKGKPSFIATIILLRDNCLVEFGSGYCEILYPHNDTVMAESFIKEIGAFKEKQKKKEFEINLISRDSYGLELKSMEIKKTKLDLSMYYEDDFIEVDKIIQSRLSKKNDKGIVLLHGLPGTGKTTYLRYLVGKLKKKVLFLSPAIAGSIMNPEFMDLLIDNPNCVVIIEDAENVIMDRRLNSDSAVSNLLNISDGILSDFLNVQVVCTFNHPLSMVDNALMRKGRLIAKYEFNKLGIGKAQQLSDRLGFDTLIKEPMTIAAIANQHEKEMEIGRVEILGFRRTAVEMN
ncbi:MAG: AAA family ATPase [Ferruginibacter sp.]